MKGPSIDAIRRFKEQQEQKKREEDERRIKEKINTLGHRAAQGDRKAKQELKKLEKTKEDSNKNPQSQVKQHNHQNQSVSHGKKSNTSQPSNTTQNKPKRPQKVETDFEELMKVANQNTNEIRKPAPPPTIDTIRQRPKVAIKPTTLNKEVKKVRIPQPASSQMKPRLNLPQTSESRQQIDNRIEIRNQPISHTLEQRIQAHKRREAALHLSRRRHMPDPNEYDDYESDGFVVDEDDDDVQDELRETLKTVFRYDKRRCDRREEELDRQYRAIGRVTTFEDLEREERRASRLAAAEDAEALRLEEERKRKKKLRLQKS